MITQYECQSNFPLLFLDFEPKSQITKFILDFFFVLEKNSNSSWLGAIRELYTARVCVRNYDGIFQY